MYLKMNDAIIAILHDSCRQHPLPLNIPLNIPRFHRQRSCLPSQTNGYFAKKH
jgi:hypothetical protein